MDTCKGCGAPIEWAKTKNGKDMPLEVDERFNGNLVIEGGVALYIRPDPKVKARMSHYANCKKALEFRKSEKEAEKKP